MSEVDRTRTDRFIGPLLGFIALAVYFVTLSVGAYPGQSARLIVQHTGIVPRFTALFPLWSGIVNIISKLPFGGVALKLNMFSAICGAASIWLLYEIVSRTVFRAVDIDISNILRARLASRLAGIVASLSFAFCTPFWIVSNRAHTASFHILLLLTATWFLFRYSSVRDSDESRREHEPYALILAFVYGVGVVEFATFIVFAPLFGLYVAFLLWRSEDLRVGMIVRLLFCAILGLTMYAVGAWLFYGTPGYEIKKYQSFFQIIWLVWKEQYFLISRSLPRQGWLITLITTVLPWLAALLVARRSLNEEKDWTYLFLHIVLTAMAAAVVMNAGFAPWPMLHMRGLLVTPYLLVASLFGYIAAYWCLFATGRRSDDEHAWRAWTKKCSGTFLVVLVLVACCIAAVRNLYDADGRKARAITEFAYEVVDSMAGRSWLVTDGSIDHQIGVAARDLNYELKLIDLSLDQNDVYQQYLASMFDRTRMKNLARMGVLPLLREWLDTDPDVEKNVAIFMVPDLWMGAGFVAVPNRAVFLGAKSFDELDADKLLKEHQSYWNAVVPNLRACGGEEDVERRISLRLLRGITLGANNLGVLMSDMDRAKEAFTAYSEALKIDRGNISALLNMEAMKKGGMVSALPEGVESDLGKLAPELRDNSRIWVLARSYGYVGTPKAFARLALDWMRIGQPRLAIAGLKRAIRLASGKQKVEAKRHLARVYFAEGYDSECEALCREALGNDPSSLLALFDLGRLATKKGDFKSAERFFKKAEKAGVARTTVQIERARMHFVAGDTKRARVLLEEVVEGDPERVSAWSLLCSVLLQREEIDSLESCLARLDLLEGGRAAASLIRGELALSQNQHDIARRHFEDALVVDAMNRRQILERLLSLDMREDRIGDMRFHVSRLLRIDPASAAGNLSIGYIQMRSDEDELAEDSFRQSLKGRKTARALANLAWLLQKRGAYEEAEERIRATIEMNARMPQVWDTLGVILMKTGRLAEAEGALDRSLQLSGDNANVHLHLLELYIAKGDEASASKLARKLTRKREQLSEDEQVSLDELLEQLPKDLSRL